MLENVALVGFEVFGRTCRITLSGQWCDGSPSHVDHFTRDPGFSWGLFTICGYAYM